MTAVLQALVNGRDTKLLDIGDRGLGYGDGVFETIAAVQGQLHFWERHMARLRAGCERLGLSPPDEQRLRFEARHLLPAEGSWVIKIILTRGAGGRGYQPLPEPDGNRIVQRLPWPGYPEDWARRGIRLGRCSLHLGRNPVLAGIKHLNRLEQVLASRELAGAQAEELLLEDPDGAVIEGTRSNLFVVHQGVVHTPDLGACGVAGIMRSVILDLCAAEGIQCRVHRLAQDDVLAADELFMTNSLMGIWPVREYAGKTYPPGPLSQGLATQLAAGVPGEQWYS